MVVAKVKTHGAVGGCCWARWARGLREGHAEAGHGAHLYGAGAGVAMGAAASCKTRPLTLVTRLLHSEKPGTPMQQNHTNLEKQSKTSEPFLAFTNDNHQNRSVGLSPIWASCLREGRDDETAGRSLSPPQTFPQSSWCWQSTALLITAKKQNDALTFGCFGLSCVHLNFSRTGPWSYLIKIHQQLQLTPKVGLVSHSNMKGKQIG